MNTRILNTRMPIPMVLRSQLELMAQGVSFLAVGDRPAANLPIASDGTTYSMAQEVTWIDADHFAVGRWDGSLGIFAFNQSPQSGPLISTAVSSPSAEGVQMITWLAPQTFCTSNDEQSAIVWSAPRADWSSLTRLATLTYDSGLGVANSGDAFEVDGVLTLVVGHANGFVSIWSGADPAHLALASVVNVRSSTPVNPWQLFNVRGVAPVIIDGRVAAVVTGSEDGDLCVLRMPDGMLLSRTVYNSTATRGINNVATLGTRLLVANCAVGPTDYNLWYFGIDTTNWKITLRNKTNLVVNPAAPQVFNFCVIWGRFQDGDCFFASTEEGALWMGTIGNDERLNVLGYQNVSRALGAALAFNVAGRLALVDYDLHEFTTLHGAIPQVPVGNPERLRA